MTCPVQRTNILPSSETWKLTFLVSHLSTHTLELALSSGTLVSASGSGVFLSPPPGTPVGSADFPALSQERPLCAGHFLWSGGQARAASWVRRQPSSSSHSVHGEQRAHQSGEMPRDGAAGGNRVSPWQAAAGPRSLSLLSVQLAPTREGANFSGGISF